MSCPAPQSDTELMRAVRDGDLSRLGVLFERHHRRLFNLFRRLGVGAAPAEDMVQEVFFRMLKYRSRFRDDGDLLPWMYQLSRNLAMDHHRKRGREAVAPDDAPEPVDTAPLAADTLERSDAALRMRRALAALPLAKRELLVLARYQLLRYDQIAEVLGCSAGAVRVRVHRAIKDLRDAYLGELATAGTRREATP